LGNLADQGKRRARGGTEGNKLETDLPRGKDKYRGNKTQVKKSVNRTQGRGGEKLRLKGGTRST